VQSFERPTDSSVISLPSLPLRLQLERLIVFRSWDLPLSGSPTAILRQSLRFRLLPTTLSPDSQKAIGPLVTSEQQLDVEPSLLADRVAHLRCRRLSVLGLSALNGNSSRTPLVAA